MHPDSAQHMGRYVPDAGRRAICGKMGHYKKLCRSKRDSVVHELKVEMVQDSQDEEIETVNMDLVHLNKNQSITTVYLDTYAGKNNVEIPYKIDTVRATSCCSTYSKNCLKMLQ